jgi:elongation factor 1-delta
MAELAAMENIWHEGPHYDEAEITYQEHLARIKRGGQPACKSATTEACTYSAGSGNASNASSCTFISRIDELQKDNQDLKKLVKDLESLVSKLSCRVTSLEKGVAAPAGAVQNHTAPAAKAAETKEDEDDFELFDDQEDEVDEDAERIKQERLKAYEEKKGKKPVLIAKSNIILDVKPWDDETDMAELEKCVRSIEMDGLLWGASKLVPLAYGIKKLQISCVVEDDKVSTEDLEEKIVAFEDFIQSMDIAAFNKV